MKNHPHSSLLLAGALLTSACTGGKCESYSEIENLEASGGKRVLAVLAENDESLPGDNFTYKEAADSFKSASDYWTNSSGGEMWLSDVAVVGPYYTTHDIYTNGAKNQLLAQVEDHDQVNFSDYDYVYYLHKTASDSQYGHAEMTNYNTSTGSELTMPAVLMTLSDPSSLPIVSAHEGLHYWLGHANFLDCGSKTLTEDPDDCERVAYMNLTSYMGFGTDKALDLTQRLIIGWVTADDLLQIRESGTYTITPRYKATPLTPEGAQIQRWTTSGEELLPFQVEWDSSNPEGVMVTMSDDTPIECVPGDTIRTDNTNSKLLDMQPSEIAAPCSDYGWIEASASEGEECEDPNEKFTLNPGSEFVDPVTGTTIGGVEIENGKISFMVTYK